MKRKRRSGKRSRKSAGTTGRRPRISRKTVLSAAGILLLISIAYLYLRYGVARPTFNGARAFRYLQLQCDFGPRVPGTEAHRRCGDFLVSELRKYAHRVKEQTFHYRDRRDSTRVYSGRNIVASFNLHPARNFRVLLCAHWDSRPRADKDPDPHNRQQPVPGANDGASGVAVLLEMARLLHESPLDYGVDIVLFDLEDLGDYTDSPITPDSLNPFGIGSEHFAKTNPTYRPAFGILLDMIGDRDLRIEREGYSQRYAPQIVEKVWRAAKQVGATAFVDEVGGAIKDDHYAFLRRGLKVIDLIDFDYPYWHTVADTPDKCSPESLQQVGKVLVEVLWGER